MVETSPSHGGDFKCLEFSLSPWNKDHGRTKCRFMSPICSKIGRGWTRDPFHGTRDFRMSFLVSLPVTFLVYGNSRKLQSIYTWISGGSKNLLRTSCFSLTQLNARCCLSAWRFFPRNVLQKSCQRFTWWTCVSTAPSSDQLSIEFLAWWLFTSLLCFQWSSLIGSSLSKP